MANKPFARRRRNDRAAHRAILKRLARKRIEQRRQVRARTYVVRARMRLERQHMIVDADDANAFMYAIALHVETGVAMHTCSFAEQTYRMLFSASSRAEAQRFMRAVHEDLQGYLCARHGWTGPVFEQPYLDDLTELQAMARPH